MQIFVKASHCVPCCYSPQQNSCIFSNQRNSKRVSSESCRWKGRLFHRRGPATVNERSFRLMQVLGTCTVTRGDVGRSKLSAAISSGKLAVIFQVLGRQAIQHFVDQTCQLNSIRCHTGSHMHKTVHNVSRIFRRLLHSAAIEIDIFYDLIFDLSLLCCSCFMCHAVSLLAKVLN